MQGKKTGTIALPEALFALPWNDALMHQVVVSMQSNARPDVAHTKNRGDVRGGGKKPWRQKGTGRARVGSNRSPIWKGGGVTHGPRNEKNYLRTIPRNMRTKALCMALSSKIRDGEVIFIDSLAFDAPKTSIAKKTLIALGGIGFDKIVRKRSNAALIALSDGNITAKKSFGNIGNVTTIPLRDLNPVAVLSAKYLVIENPAAGIAILSRRLASKKEHATT